MGSLPLKRTTIDGRKWTLPPKRNRTYSQPPTVIELQVLHSRLPVQKLSQEELSVRGWAREWIGTQRSVARRNVTRKALDEQSVTIQSLMDLWSAQKGKCAISGRALRIVQLRKQGDIRTEGYSDVISVDRIDSSKPYHISNIQLVCRAINAMKSNMPQRIFEQWCCDVASSSDIALSIS